MSEHDNGEWEIYLEHRKQISEIIVNQTNIFDKSMIALSTGGIGLSILLISNLKGVYIDLSTQSLVYSWISFLTCIFSNLSSYFTSAIGGRKIIDQLDENMKNGVLHQDPSNIWGSFTSILNFLALISFFAGAIFLLIFAVSAANSAKADETGASTKSEEIDGIRKEASDALSTLDALMGNQLAPPRETGVTPISPPISRPLPKPESETVTTPKMETNPK